MLEFLASNQKRRKVAKVTISLNQWGIFLKGRQREWHWLFGMQNANSDIFFVELKEKSQLLRALIYVIIRPQDKSGGKYGFLVYVLEI